MRTTEHPYAPFVHLVQKPARYLGGEFGAKTKDWNAVKARVCLAFPDVYDIGMSHLGYKILYKILNDAEGTLAERCYAPWIDMEKELRTRKLPLVSLESARPLRDFDVVGFSLQFELTYTNILTMLDLGGIPLRAADRGESDPLVIAGGPTATHPEPISAFMDCVLVGDGEEKTSEVALLWTKLKSEGVPRAERLVRIAALDGIYVPSLYETELQADTGFEVVVRSTHPAARIPVRRTLVADINDYPFPDDGPIGGPEAIFDRMSIEIARGCTEGCRFCQAGMIYRPVRERDPEQIVQTVVSAVKKSGYDEVSLTALSTADFSCIAPLVKKVVDKLAPEKISLGISSLRAYGLEENVLDDMQRVRASGVTFAPEAGSQRMRDVVNKNVTEEQLMTTAERVFSRGWAAMKLYFMIGLPTEEEEDVREIARVGSRARDVGKRVKAALKSGGAPKVTVSVSTHVPKPHTPFQWCAMDAPASIHQKQSWLREEAKNGKIDLRMHDCETSWLEGVFARGDRSLAPVLEKAYREGARFDSWEDQKRMDIWEKTFAEFGIDVAKFLGTIPVTARLPWDHVDVGLEEGFLAREYRKALKSRLSPPCGKAAGMFVHHTNLADAHEDTRKLVCYDCGVACDLGAMREERLVYLRKLGAETPRPLLLAKTAPEGDAATIKKNAKRPPASFVQGTPHRYRFMFTKTGPSAFLSHLDLIRALPRAFRRMELPLYYSQGFHPKPDLVFAPALSLGVASLAEYVDAKITMEFDPSAVVQGLTDSSPEGLVYLGAVRLGPEDPTIARVIDCARYVVGVPRSALSDLGGAAGLAAEVDAFLADTSRIVIRRIDGVGKKVDVRDFVKTLEIDTERAHEAIRRAGFVGDLVPLLVDVEIRGSGSAKVSEVMETLATARATALGLPPADLFPYRAVRVGLGMRMEDGSLTTPLELETLRAERARLRALADAASLSEEATASAIPAE
ncbi:MAG: TIGR03960 family B12-binding radical SAM protein [Polyangiaceae bacterium]